MPTKYRWNVSKLKLRLQTQELFQHYYFVILAFLPHFIATANQELEIGFTSEITFITFSTQLQPKEPQKPVCGNRTETVFILQSEGTALYVWQLYLLKEKAKDFSGSTLWTPFCPEGKIQGSNHSPPSTLIYSPIEMVQLSMTCCELSSR